MTWRCIAVTVRMILRNSKTLFACGQSVTVVPLSRGRGRLVRQSFALWRGLNPPLRGFGRAGACKSFSIDRSAEGHISWKFNSLG